MEEVGLVKDISGDMATVVVEKKSMCSHCQEGTCSLTDEGAEIEALNLVGARVGQKVKVVSRSISFLKGSILIYGLPAFALILGAILGKELLPFYFNTVEPDLLSAIGGFSAFLISFIVIKIISYRLEKKPEYKPVIERIIDYIE